MGPGQVYTISRKGDQLIFSVPGMNFSLVTLSKTEFLLAFADARITFQKDKEVTGFIIDSDPVRDLVFAKT